MAFRLPKELSEIINSNPEFWSNLLRSTGRENFIATLRNAVSNSISESIPFSVKGFDQWTIDKDNESIAKSLGFSGDYLTKFLDLLEILGNSNGKSTRDREREYLVPLYTPIESKQKGGLISTTVADNKSVRSVKVEDSKDINKAAGTNNKGMSFFDQFYEYAFYFAQIILN